MAIQDSKRLNIVTSYLYPNLVNDLGKDYYLQNDSDGKGTYLVWLTGAVSEPTAEQLADAKEPAINDFWWKLLRKERDRRLVQSDWSQGTDVPSSLKTEYATYRTKLRDLPTTVTKPSFSTLNGQETPEWGINDLMPTKPEE